MRRQAAPSSTPTKPHTANQLTHRGARSAIGRHAGEGGRMRTRELAK